MFRALTLMLAFAATPTLAQTISADTFRGTVTVQANPKTIAVLDLTALDNLVALGVKTNGAVRPLYLPYLENSASDSAPVGSLFEPDLEALNALQPDLIIAGGRSSKQIPTLAKLAPTIDMTIDGDTVIDGLARLETLGEIFGKQAQANDLITSFNAKLAKTKTLTKDMGRALIIMTNGPKISAYGSTGRFGWLHTATGFQQAVEDMEKTTHGEAVSFEFIKDANPDVLLVVDRLAAIGRDGDTAQSTLDNALVHETPAWKNGRVIYLSSAPIYIASGGIQSMNQTLDELNAALMGQ